jgi:tryptophanyl-tRNA synthetase
MRILTGIQPSGKLHIGNYFGSMKAMIDFMNNSQDEVFVMLADYHALTSLQDPKLLKEYTNNAILDWIACGLNPEKVFFYLQSDIPEVQELSWLLHTVSPMGILNKATSYKDKIAKGVPASSALFTYPVLQTADILLFNADIVPVGKDQKQHLEISRDIAQKFNNTYSEIFTIPEVQITESQSLIPGTDGQKMSKSYGNTIPLFESESQTRKKIMSIVTNSQDVHEKKDPKTCTVFALYKLVSSLSEQEFLAKKYTDGGMGYGEAKKILFEAIKTYFSPMWEKRKILEEDPSLINKVRALGVKKAKPLAQKMIIKARKSVGIESY